MLGSASRGDDRAVGGGVSEAGMAFGAMKASQLRPKPVGADQEVAAEFVSVCITRDDLVTDVLGLSQGEARPQRDRAEGLACLKQDRNGGRRGAA